jgi:hypothetical protein
LCRPRHHRIQRPCSCGQKFACVPFPVHHCIVTENLFHRRRGLSSFYAGKSKSFTSLAEAAAAAAAREIAKPENPFNKRRRVLQAWSRRRASCSALAAAYLPPLLAPDHAVVEEDDEEGADDEEEDEEDEEHGDGGGLRGRRRPPTFPSPRLSVHVAAAGQMARNGSFRSPRSFSMTDLHSAAGYE